LKFKVTNKPVLHTSSLNQIQIKTQVKNLKNLKSEGLKNVILSSIKILSQENKAELSL